MITGAVVGESHSIGNRPFYQYCLRQAAKFVGGVRLAAELGRGRLRCMSSSRHPYRRFRFPAVIIAHAVWLYHCFNLSLQGVELILDTRGVTVSYENIRDWAIRFGRQFSTTLRRCQPKSGIIGVWKRCLSGSGGNLHYLRRAVDQNGGVLHILV